MIRPQVQHEALELSALVAHVTDYAIFALDPQGRISTWNAGAEKLKGYAADEVIGEHFSRFHPREDVLAGRPARLLGIAAREGHVRDEGWRVRKDGSRFWADVVITAVKDDRGRVRGFLKVTRDLTERRAAQELLRQSEERLRLLVEGVEDYAIFMLDPDGRVASWNAGAQRINGYAPEEIIGRHFSAFYPPEDGDKPARELAEAIARGRVEDEGWRVRKDGTRLWASVVITALRDDAGVLRGFAKVTRDITERRRAAQELATRARQQAALAQLGVFALQAADLQQVLDRAAEAVGATLEVDLASVVEARSDGLVMVAGRGWDPANIGALRLDDASTFQAARAGGAPVSSGGVDEPVAEPELRARGVARSVVVPVPDRGAASFLLGAHRREPSAFSREDVLFLQGVANVVGAAVLRRRTEVERALAERQARVAEERRALAEEALRERDVFISIMAHELRTPIAALALKLASLGRLVERPDAGERLAKVLPERVTGALRQTQRLGLLIERVLDVSRIAAGRLQLEREPCDLAGVARDVVEDLREHARQSRTTVSLVAADGVVGVWDRARLLQILTNLLDNALKYGAGRPVEVVVEGDATTGRVRVTDQGPGIPAEEHERLFQRFQRAAPATSYPGMGLGLYVSKRLALAHGGDISLTSEPGHGCVFELRLPRNPPEERAP